MLPFESSPLFAIAMVQLVDPIPWGRSVADKPFLEAIVAAGVLLPNTDPARPVWIAPGSSETEPNPLSYLQVISLASPAPLLFVTPRPRA